jgi:hypothetical protein
VAEHSVYRNNSSFLKWKLHGADLRVQTVGFNKKKEQTTMVYYLIIGFYLLLYAWMIFHDLFHKEPVEIASKTEEEEIDISEEAKAFKPIEVSKEMAAAQPLKGGNSVTMERKEKEVAMKETPSLESQPMEQEISEQEYLSPNDEVPEQTLSPEEGPVPEIIPFQSTEYSGGILMSILHKQIEDLSQKDPEMDDVTIHLMKIDQK